MNTKLIFCWNGLVSSFWAAVKADLRLLFKICEYVLAVPSRRCSSGQIFSQNILSWEVCKGDLRVCTRSHISQLKLLLTLFSQLIVADLLQNWLRLCTLISVNSSSQFHLAHVPQIGLRPLFATSDSHIAIPQLADSSQKGLRLLFKKFARMYSQHLLAASSVDPTATSDWNSARTCSHFLLAAHFYLLYLPLTRCHFTWWSCYVVHELRRPTNFLFPSTNNSNNIKCICFKQKQQKLKQTSQTILLSTKTRDN